MTVQFANQLNDQQLAAVTQVNGPSIILAGAGSGKTRILVYKVLNLIINHQINPGAIMMITFTNKAAGEMKERITKKTGDRFSPVGFIGTFHAFCAKVLRLHGTVIGLSRNFIIYDEADQLNLIKTILKKSRKQQFSYTYYLSRISAAKNQLISPDRYQSIFNDHQTDEIVKVYKQYQQALKKNRAVDFDDLLFLAVELFRRYHNIVEYYQNKFRYILVDEFQDTNYAQYHLVKLIGEKYKNVTVVGDFSQSIYSWRGADITNLNKFETDFPATKVFYLEQNYRSTQYILDFAYQVIANNQTHPILKLFTQKQGGEEVYFYQADNEEAEAIFITKEIIRLSKQEKIADFAVLYRTNAQSRIIEEVFLHFGLPYVLIGGTRFYERKEIKDILAYLRLLVNPQDSIAADRVKKIGKRRYQKFKESFDQLHKAIDSKTTDQLMEEIFSITGYLELYSVEDEENFDRLENIKELKSVAVSFPKLTEFLEQVALVESEYFASEKTVNRDSRLYEQKNQRVKLMTLHQAKGLEFPYVFIVGVEEGILPHSRSVDDRFQLEEERRLFYVGITRAQRKLYITYTKRRFIFGRTTESIKSRFLLETGY